MIHVVISSQRLRFTSDTTGRSATLLFRKHLGVFGHPRHPIADPDKAAKIIAPVLRSLVTGIIAPKVSYRFDSPLEGGVTQVDLRTIKDTFILAGARRVEPESVKPTGGGNRR